MNTPNIQEESKYRAVMQALVDAPEGQIKNASEDASELIRLKLRETGYQRAHILPFKPIKPTDISPSLDSELPWRIEEMEASQGPAVNLNYDDTADYQPYKLDKFAMYFYDISTPVFQKNVTELLNYAHDPREVVTNNMLLDVQTQEDSNFTRLVDFLAGSPTGVGQSGVQQNFNIYGRISRVAYKESLKHLLNVELTNGVFLLNRTTAIDFLGWGRDEAGGDISQDMFENGLEALSTFSFFKVPHVATLKRNLVPDNVQYGFAPKNFMGKAYELTPLTVFMKKERKVIEMYATETISTAIANTKSVKKTTFVP